MRAVALVIVDLVLIAAATAGALVLRDNLDLTLDRWGQIVPYLSFTLAIALPVIVGLGLNRSIWRFSALSDALRVVVAVLLVVTGAMVAGFAFNRLEGVARSLPILQAMLMVFALVGVRVLVRMRHDLRRGERPPGGVEAERPHTVLLVGVSSLTELYLRAIGDFAAGRVRVAGIVGARPRHANRFVRMHKVLGVPEDVDRIVQDLAIHGIDVDRIVVTIPLPRLSLAARAALGRVESAGGVQLDLLAERLGLAAADETRIGAGAMPAAPIFKLDSTAARSLALRPYWQVKRAVDLVVALVLLFVLSPLLAVLAVAVAVRLGWPAVFWQERLGAGGVPFLLYKFRSMSASHDAGGRRIPDADRVSTLGTFLRRTRLDELPQLINIVRGEMSFVGPRPLLHSDQSSHFAVRRLVRPGLTGWAQINGGRDVTPTDKAALDLWYVQNASLWLDLKIVLRTVPIVLLGERANADAVHQAWRDLTRLGLCGLRPAVAGMSSGGAEDGTKS